jgi:WD40 repeat protein
MMAGQDAQGVMTGGMAVLKEGVLQPWCMAESADRKWLVIGGGMFTFDTRSQEAAILLCERASREPKELHRGPIGFVTAVAFAPNGRTLASGSSEGEVKLWHLSAGGMKERARVKPHTSMVFSLAFSSDGKRLASAGADNLVVLTDAKDGKQQAALQGHVHPVSSICFSANDRTLVSADVDGRLKVWDCHAPTGPRSIKLDSREIVSLHFTHDGNSVVAIDQAGFMKRINPGTGRDLASVQILGDVGQLPFPLMVGFLRRTTVAVSADRKTVALPSSRDRCVLVCDAASGKALRKVPMPKNPLPHVLECSPDGRLLAVATSQAKNMGEIALWDVASGKQLPLTGGVREGQHVDFLSFSPDGKFLASSATDRIVRLWDVAARKEQRAFPAGSERPSCIAFSPNSRFLAVAAGDNLTIREVKSGHEVLSWRGYHRRVSRMVFSPDGRRLVTAIGGDELGRGGGIKVWDVATGLEVLSLGGAADVVNCIALGPDGKRLASAHAPGGFLVNVFGNKVGGELRIWDATPMDDDRAKR